jgi:lipopolysaccharide/colanic/teichoic acid biosynthesis glycosyltransferase
MATRPAARRAAHSRPGLGSRPGWGDPIRRGADVVVAAGALALLGIPMLVVALLVRLDSPGSPLYRQERVGLGRKPFTLYKFRTMRVGADDALLREMITRELAGEDTSSHGSWKLDADPRITRVGALLRRSNIDELPQLVNVLNGTMTLVGPRPCLAWEAEMFPSDYADRFSVRPGLTGLWQINGRSTVGTLDMLALDVRYVRSRSLRGDLVILARTIPALLGRDGAR